MVSHLAGDLDEDATMQMMVSSIKEKIDTKSFIMIDSIKLTRQNLSDFVHWYICLVSHATINGVFIPPYDSFKHGNVISSVWKTMDNEKSQQCDELSQMLYQLLLTPKELKDYQHIIENTAINGLTTGYTTLYQIT